MNQEQRNHVVAISKHLSLKVSNAPDATGRRLGILNLAQCEHPDPADFANWSKELMHHQIICVHRLMVMNVAVPFYARKASLLAMHDMGTGKTILSVLALAGIYKIAPRLQDFVALVIVPLTVLSTWCETLDQWTTLGTKIVKAQKPSDITADTLKGPVVIVTTKDVLVSCYKTFMWFNPEAEVWYTKGDKRQTRPGWVPGTDPTAHVSAKTRISNELRKGPDGVLPPHPLYAHIERCKTTRCPDIGFVAGEHAGKYADAMLSAFSVVVADEIHMMSNPKTRVGGIVALMCAEATYVLGLTGTPVRSKPSQCADICRTINVKGPDGSLAWMGERRNWSVPGKGSSSIRPATITAFHKDACDRVDDSTIDLPECKTVLVQFDPFIGRKPDGTYDEENHEIHDAYLNRAQKAAVDVNEGGARNLAYRESLMSAFNSSAQFSFSGVLGMHGAQAFTTDKGLYRKALEQPSEQQRLIWRMLRNRQSQGHGRVVVYSESAVMLEMLINQLSVWGGCGKLLLFTGKSNLAQRDAKVSEFLDKATPRGVLFISAAGAVGTTLCPGCDTLFVVGDIPWTGAELTQAIKRVHRITQDKAVEIVQFEPRRSIISIKYEAHAEENNRLYPAIRDLDFSNFKEGLEQWRTRNVATLNMATLDEEGNYLQTAEMTALRELWKQDCEAAEAAGDDPPAEPSAIAMPEPKLADDYALPPCSFPVEGFVEPPCAAYPSPNKYSENKNAKLSRPRVEEDSDAELDDSDEDNAEDEEDEEGDSDDSDASVARGAAAIVARHRSKYKKQRLLPVAMSVAEKTSLDVCMRAIAMRKALFPDSDNEDEEDNEDDVAKEEDDEEGLFD